MKTPRKRIVISLFDASGIMVEPWRQAGCECWIVDIRHPVALDNGGITTTADGLHMLCRDLSTPWLFPGNREDVAIVFAFPPCDHLAVSGARWFKGKGLRLLARSIELFASAVEFCIWMRAPYMIENPVSTISSYWRVPDYTFHPWHYTAFNPSDNYTKKTCLWTGNGFVMPKRRVAEPFRAPDHRIHLMQPGNRRAYLRSLTPEGFAKAVFQANRKFI